MGGLSSRFIGIFVFVGMFAMLIALMPVAFTQNDPSFISPNTQDKEVVAFFAANNVTVYNQTLQLNLSYPEAKKFEYGFSDPNDRLEFWWGNEIAPYPAKILEVRHCHLTLFGWWWQFHRLQVSEAYRSKVSYKHMGLILSDIIALADENQTQAYCEFECEHITVKLFILPYNETWTLTESWNNNILNLYTSYEVDWTATATGTFTVLTQLMTFNAPALGIPGVFGEIVSYGIGAMLWASIIILIFAVITSLLPFVSGWGDK